MSKTRKLSKKSIRSPNKKGAEFPTLAQFEELQKELNERNSKFNLKMLTNAANYVENMKSSNVSKVFGALRMRNKYTKKRNSYNNK